MPRGRRVSTDDYNDEFIPPAPPATTPEEREKQLIGYAFDLVEKRIIKGTASAQETVHFLKLGGETARLERLKLEAEIEMKQAGIEQMRKSDRVEELFDEAIKAFRGYSGQEMEEDDADFPG